MTREMLDDLLAEVPRQVVPSVDAAWRAGTLRRRFRYASGTVAAVVMVVLAAVAILGFDPSPRVEPADGGAVTGYPSEIPRPIILTPLPDKPGPMAGVIVMEGIGDVAVVDAHGRSWLIPDVSPWEDERPTLSADGRMLGYLSEVSDQRSEFVLIDLVTGSRTTFPEVGDRRLINDVPETDQPYFTDGQSPRFWSPDNRWLAVQGSAHEDAKPGPLLLGADGQVRELGVGTWPVGWVGPDRVAVLTTTGQLRTVDVDGEVLTRVELEIREPFEVFGQWAAALSPDGARIAVRAATDDRDTVFVLDTRTGGWDTQMWYDDQDSCQLQWQSNEQWQGDERVLTWDRAYGLVNASNMQQIVMPSPDWGELSCGTFAADALSGQPQDGPALSEWRYWGWLWWWRWIVAVAVASVAVMLIRRLRRFRAANSPA